MKNSIGVSLQEYTASGKKALAVLFDSDKTREEELIESLNVCLKYKVNYLFVGGGLESGNNLHEVVSMVKSYTDIPCILFPSNAIQIDASADAILFLSLISGRNPELLIGQHVVAAPIIKKSHLEVIPTGYILVGSGKPSGASYKGDEQSLPYNKPGLAASTALAGQMLGLKTIYMDVDNGEKTIPARIIKAVKNSISIPLMVGGMLNTATKAKQALVAGADLITLSIRTQEDFSLLTEVAETVYSYNQDLINRF